MHYLYVTKTPFVLFSSIHDRKGQCSATEPILHILYQIIIETVVQNTTVLVQKKYLNYY